MASGSGKRKKRQTRATSDYLSSAKTLSKYVPSLKKFKNRKTLTKSEKASIRRREKQLKNIPFLVPLSTKQAQKIGRKKLFRAGVQAIQLRNVTSDAKITFRGPDVYIVDNGQRWVYWSLDRDTVRSRRDMREAGKKAFEKQFPIDIVSDIAAKAFKKYHVQQVHLWAHAGIVGEAFHTIEQFVMWVNEKWNQGRYVTTRELASGDIYTEPSDPGKWVNGIAILLEDEQYTKNREALNAQASAQNKKLVSAKRRKKRT